MSLRLVVLKWFSHETVRMEWFCVSLPGLFLIYCYVECVYIAGIVSHRLMFGRIEHSAVGSEFASIRLVYTLIGLWLTSTDWTLDWTLDNAQIVELSQVKCIETSRGPSFQIQFVSALPLITVLASFHHIFFI